MKFTLNYIRLILLVALGFTVNNYAVAQCTTPVITSITNNGPLCDGETLQLNAAGTIGGVSSSFVRMAGIGGNFGNAALNQVFGSGDRPGSMSRISNAQFNAIFASQTTDAARAAAIKAQYDVLLFTWASPTNTAITWGLIEAYLATGGSVFWEDDVNINRLSPGVVGQSWNGSWGCSYQIVFPAPFPVLVANGINGCFANHHLKSNSWPSWMDVYIKGSSTENLAIAGIYPGGNHGRLIVQGPDQDFHAFRGAGGTAGNQYQILLNQIDFLVANQGGFTWTGPNGFTSNDANPTISNVSAANAGVYTATLTNVTGGGCSTTATTTVVINSITAYNVTGGGSYCAGGAGVAIGVSNSQSGIFYQLKNGSVGVGSPVAGTGSAISFGNITTAGTYTVQAITMPAACSKNMIGSATVSVNPTPNASITSTTNITCNGGSDGEIVIAASGGTPPYTDAGTHSGLTAGTYSYNVTDAKGCSAGTFTATLTQPDPTSCTISVTPSNNTYTGGVATNLYLGYGPQSATITATATGGSGFSYSWAGPTSSLSCTNCANPVFTPTSGGTYTFTVTVTNSNGCISTCNVTFCVKDIRDGVSNNPNNQKVWICHAPPGNPSNTQTLSISVNAVPSHLSNHSGDRLGRCDQNCGASKNGTGVELMTSGDVKIYPNPTTGMFVVELPGEVLGGEAIVMDMSGRIIEKKAFLPEMELRFDLSSVAKGIYMIHVQNGDNTYRTKVSVK
jgi:hypothetical protein